FGGPQLRLVVSGALVVVIVIVIIVLSWGRRRNPLRHVPDGCAWVGVTRMDRFLASPIYDRLRKADHPISLELRAFENNHDVRLKDDVQVVAETEGATILMGHFLPRRMRKALEAGAKATALSQGLAEDALAVQEDEVEGQPYLFVAKATAKGPVDRALAWRGTSIVCSGDRSSVQSFLAVAAGRRDSLLADDSVAALYRPARVRGALFFRLEKPEGAVLGDRLGPVMLDAAAGVRAALYTISCTDDEAAVGVWLLARDDEAAAHLDTRLQTPEAAEALIALIGCDDAPEVGREGPLVALTAVVTMDRFEALVELDKAAIRTGEPRTLIHLLLD
ncbi:hypothetical protein HQ560_21580, partial [bacterium]|nr:hypothetical protein [bacterium]